MSSSSTHGAAGVRAPFLFAPEPCSLRPHTSRSSVRWSVARRWGPFHLLEGGDRAAVNIRPQTLSGAPFRSSGTHARQGSAGAHGNPTIQVLGFPQVSAHFRSAHVPRRSVFCSLISWLETGPSRWAGTPQAASVHTRRRPHLPHPLESRLPTSAGPRAAGHDPQHRGSHTGQP